MNSKSSLSGQMHGNGSVPEPKPGRPAKSPKGTAFDRALAQTDIEARRKAAAILEVLAGVRKPIEAARALGIGAMRYYLLETRAIQGLVKACEPAKLGPKVSPDREVHVLRKQVAKLERDCARYAALARTAQRVVNLSAPPASTTSASGKKVRRRRPPVRATRLAARLQSGIETPAPGTTPPIPAPVAGGAP